MKSRSEELFERIKTGGEEAIDELILNAVSEELYLDFKRSTGEGGGKALHNKDRANYGRAISGFGNSEGGVIVWGLECKPDADGADVVGTKFPIEKPQRFKSWLEGATSGVTVPAHGSVEHNIVSTADVDKGFVVTMVPKSNDAPHQTVHGQRYYMRAGSSFLPVPHAVLAGMFGRRPQPWVYHRWDIPTPERLGKDRVKLSVGLVLHNDGPGIAELMFVNVLLEEFIGPNCKLSFSNPDLQDWSGYFSYARHLSVIARDGVRLPPKAWVTPFNIEIELHPPFETPFKFSGECGAVDTETWRFDMHASPADIEKGFSDFIEAMDSGVSAFDAATLLTDPILRRSDREL